MKKSSPLVVIIPLTVIAVLVAAVFVYRYQTTQPNVAIPPITSTKTAVPSLQGSAGKPKSGFTVSTSPTPGPVSDLSQQLDSVRDDSAESDLSALHADTASL